MNFWGLVLRIFYRPDELYASDEELAANVRAVTDIWKDIPVTPEEEEAMDDL